MATVYFQEKRSVKSITSDKSKNDSESSKMLEEERKKYLELQKELDLQVKLPLYIYLILPAASPACTLVIAVKSGVCPFSRIKVSKIKFH